MKLTAAFLALCGLALCLAVPLVVDRAEDNFSTADLNGDGVLSGREELANFLVLESQSSPSAVISKSDVLGLANDAAAALIESGQTELSRDDAGRLFGLFSGDDDKEEVKAKAEDLSFLKTEDEMTVGCQRIRALAAEECKEWKPVAKSDGVECAGYQDLPIGRVIRGTVLINAPVAAVQAAVSDKAAWPKHFDKTLTEAPLLRDAGERGSVVQMHWFQTWWAEATVQEKWCTPESSFAVSVEDPEGSKSWKALGVSVHTAGIALSSTEDGKATWLTYISGSDVDGFKPEWTQGAEQVQAVDIPLAIKRAVEASA